MTAVAVLHRHHHIPFLHHRVLRPRDRGNRPRQPSTDYVLGAKLNDGSERRSSRSVGYTAVNPSVEPRGCELRTCFGNFRRRAGYPCGDGRWVVTDEDLYRYEWQARPEACNGLPPPQPSCDIGYRNSHDIMPYLGLGALIPHHGCRSCYNTSRENLALEQLVHP